VPPRDTIVTESPAPVQPVAPVVPVPPPVVNDNDTTNNETNNYFPESPAPEQQPSAQPTG
jgi:hypothetical protein